MKKLLVVFVLVLAMVIPDMAFARGFSGMSSSRSSFSSSSSRSFNSSSYSRPSSSSYSSSRPTVSLSKSSGSFSGRTSSRSSSGSTHYNSAYSASAKKSMTSGSFSGRTSTRSPYYRTGSVYRSTPTRAYYGGHYVTVSHYYHVGYSPFGWGGYYDGFSTGMFYGSLYHPWGGTYYVHGAYTDYGPSPIAWIVDVFALGILILIICVIVKAIRRPKTIFTRKF